VLLPLCSIVVPTPHTSPQQKKTCNAIHPLAHLNLTHSFPDGTHPSTTLTCNVQRIAAEKLLLQFQEHPQSWQRVDVILTTAQSQTTKYFALQVRGKRAQQQSTRAALPHTLMLARSACHMVPVVRTHTVCGQWYAECNGMDVLGTGCEHTPSSNLAVTLSCKPPAAPLTCILALPVPNADPGKCHPVQVGGPA
jgi:hypothetical protein